MRLVTDPRSNSPYNYWKSTRNPKICGGCTGAEIHLEMKRVIESAIDSHWPFAQWLLQGVHTDTFPPVMKGKRESLEKSVLTLWIESVLSMDIHELPRNEVTDEIKDDLALKTTKSLDHDVVFGEITEDGPNYRNVLMNRLRCIETPTTSWPLSRLDLWELSLLWWSLKSA